MREPLKRDGKEFSLDLPEKYICGDCKNFTPCNLKDIAIANDEQCSWIPNDFAFFGQESQAERLNRQDMEKMEEVNL